MKFSILIANYNNGKYFKDCYDSILSQTYTNWEAIIVDDKSTDDSVKIIKELIDGDIRFRLYKNEKNQGCGYTKNKCAQLATGKIMGFLDPDDTLTPDALTLSVEAHHNNPDAALVHSKLMYCDVDLQKIQPYRFSKVVQVDSTFTNLEFAVTAFSSFKTEYYFLTKGINAELIRAVDQDLYLKLSEVGDFFYLDLPLYNYRLHDGGITSRHGGKAFYNHLKVIIEAEKRRQVDLSGKVGDFLQQRNDHNKQIQDVGQLMRQILGLTRINMKGFLRKIIRK